MSSIRTDLPVYPSTFVELLRQRAVHQVNQCAYIFLKDGESEEAHLTYGELDQQARAVAAMLQDLEATGECALLLYPPGLEFITAFFGCLYAGVIAVPVYPPNPAKLDQSLPRLLAVASDARPSLALTTSAFLPIAKLLSTQYEAFQSIRWLATDALPDDLAEVWDEPLVNANTLAFLQYTSGSTASPKGVTLTHMNLLHNSRLIYQAFNH
jgi:acyl-CoA synthetase (AMP-forming)/AMP-acid ligase II